MSPVVETVRSIPLIVEQMPHIPMEVEEISGFPFDREGDRDGHFRSQLDDIAKRHPEFAEHLGNFSLRSSPRRQSSGGAEDADVHRRFERPFGGRFERFGFPFDRDDDFDPEQYAQQFHQPQQEFQQQAPHPHFQQQTSYQPQPSEYHTAQQPQPQQSPQPANTENPPPEPEQRDRNIQQSNTIDLGQKQEPVNERNQRSMSAPPTEKGQRFTSSIKIPVNQPPSESENMPQTQPSDGKTTERIIPIHIEGRDEPVLPKNAPSSYSQPHQTFRAASPQPERIFGQRPEHYTQFVNREPRQYEKWQPQFETMHHGFAPEEPVRQQRYQPQQNVPPHYQQQQQRQPQYQQQAPPQPKEEIPIPVQRDIPPTKQQAPQQEAAPPPQPKPAPQQQKPLTPIDQIQIIQKDVSALLAQVEQFAGQPKDKQYLYLDEMLTRNLLKLDNIDTQGQDNIRSARKEAIKCIERAIGVLEAKAAANVEPPKVEEKMEVEEKSPEPAAATESEDKQSESAQAMETEPAVNAENKVEENQKQTMEIVPESANVASPPAVENKEENKPAEVAPQVEAKVEGAQQTEDKTEAPAVEVLNAETCEGQESNLPVAEAVKKFEGAADKDEKKVESSDSKAEENKEASSQGEASTEEKKQEKKEKKKGKKKAEKKEK